MSPEGLAQCQLRDSEVATTMKIRFKLTWKIFLFKFWDRAPQTTICRAIPGLRFIISDRLFLFIKSYWNTTSFMYLNTMYVCFHAITAGLRVVTKTISSTKARKYLLSDLVYKKCDDPNPGSQCDRGDKTLSKSCSCLPPPDISEMPHSSNPGPARRPDQFLANHSCFLLKPMYSLLGKFLWKYIQVLFSLLYFLLVSPLSSQTRLCS